MAMETLTVELTEGEAVFLANLISTQAVQFGSPDAVDVMTVGSSALEKLLAALTADDVDLDDV